MRLALVHDWLVKLGGAERVLIELHRIYPDAPIYTLFYDKAFVRQWLPDADIRPSYLQKIPLLSSHYHLFAVLMPMAIESFDLSDFDTVLSSSVIFSKGLVLRSHTRHISYCYSPTRMLWDRNSTYERQGVVSRVTRHFMRLWDRSAADRVDQFVAISKAVQSRISKYYNKDSVVIYPPLVPLPDPGDQVPAISEFYLIVSRLYPHKNIEIAVEAFNKLGYNLAVVGDGPLRRKLESKAKQNIFFVGSVNDATLAACYRSCRALILPQEEDFGLTPLEAMSFGKPVLALRKGGALETVIEGVSGEFFDDPIPEALADGVKRLNKNWTSYNPTVIKRSVSGFSLNQFRQAIGNMVQ